MNRSKPESKHEHFVYKLSQIGEEEVSRLECEIYEAYAQVNRDAPVLCMYIHTYMFYKQVSCRNVVKYRGLGLARIVCGSRVIEWRIVASRKLVAENAMCLCI